MIFLGNSASFHLKTWRQIYDLTKNSVDHFYSIHPIGNNFPGGSRVRMPTKLLSYLALGLRLRTLSKAAQLHAHGASGYGLSALISGRPYIATVYGSEILRPHGFVYRQMIRAVLRGATAITVTSTEAKNRIGELYPEALQKTYCFHTGIDLEEAEEVRRSTPTLADGMLRLMLLRNAAPHYRTREVLEAIARTVGDRADITVIVPIGNGDRQYFEDLKYVFSGSQFQFIDEPLDHKRYLAVMASADICLNYPISDQVTSTLLESLYLDRVVVTNKLSAYDELLVITDGTNKWFIVEGEQGLAKTISEAIRYCELVQGDTLGGRELVRLHYSIESAAAAFSKVLERFR